MDTESWEDLEGMKNFLREKRDRKPLTGDISSIGFMNKHCHAHLLPDPVSYNSYLELTKEMEKKSNFSCYQWFQSRWFFPRCGIYKYYK